MTFVLGDKMLSVWELEHITNVLNLEQQPWDGCLIRRGFESEQRTTQEDLG